MALDRQMVLKTNATKKPHNKPAPGPGPVPYIRRFPKNPYNNETTVKIVGNSEELPANATGNFAYFYKPASKTIKLDWLGNDSASVAYFDY